MLFSSESCLSFLCASALISTVLTCGRL